MDASEIYSKRLNAKEVIFSKENGEFIIPIEDERIQLLGGDQDLRTSILLRQRPIQGVEETYLENQKGLFRNLKTHFRVPVKR